MVRIGLAVFSALALCCGIVFYCWVGRFLKKRSEEETVRYFRDRATFPLRKYRTAELLDFAQVAEQHLSRFIRLLLISWFVLFFLSLISVGIKFYNDVKHAGSTEILSAPYLLMVLAAFLILSALYICLDIRLRRIYRSFLDTQNTSSTGG